MASIFSRRDRRAAGSGGGEACGALCGPCPLRGGAGLGPRARGLGVEGFLGARLDIVRDCWIGGGGWCAAGVVRGGGRGGLRKPGLGGIGGAMFGVAVLSLMPALSPETVVKPWHGLLVGGAVGLGVGILVYRWALVAASGGVLCAIGV